MITTGGAGSTSSVGEASYHKGEGEVAAQHEGIRKETQVMKSESVALSKSQESTARQEASAAVTIANNTRTDSGYNIDTSTQEGKELHKGLNKIDAMSKSNGYSWQQNAEAYAKADLALGGGFAKALGIDVGGGGKISASNLSDQSDSSSASINNETNVSERNGVSSNSSKHSAYLESVGVDKTQQTSMNESFSETTRLENSVGVHKDNLDARNQALDYSKSNSSDFNKDMTQDVIEAYKKQYGASDAMAAKEVLSGSPTAKAVWKQISTNNANELLQQVRASGATIDKSTSIDDFKEENKGAINKNPGGDGGSVNKFANNNGMQNKDKAAQDIEETKINLKGTHDTKVNETSEDIGLKKMVMTKDEALCQDNMKNHDKNRIGNDRLSKALEVLSYNPITGKSNITPVGRPSEQPIPEFTPIMSYYGSSEQISSLDKHQVVKPSNGTQDFSPEAARSLIQEFKPDNTGKAAVINEGQHVDASKKIKG